MFFAGISIFILSGLATLIVMGLALIIWMINSPNTTAMLKMMKYTVPVTLIGAVMTVVGGGNL